MTIEVRGELLTLRPDRTLLWQDALVLADPHFGKAESFRQAGLPLPATTPQALSRLTIALKDTNARRLIVLGDFWHDRASITPEVIDALNAWRKLFADLPIHLLRGNHDRAAPPAAWAPHWQPEPFVLGPFAFRHQPSESIDGFVMAGHIHPAVRISGRGRQSLRLPCFHLGSHSLVLPAFGLSTGLAEIRAHPGDRAFAVAGAEIVEVPISAPRH